jgi:lipoprotein-anchoring transpeptidase ErfK/SrfK
VRRAGFILCLSLVCALGAGAVSASADDVPPPTEVLLADGVAIGSVQVGGLTVEQAAESVVHAYLAPVTLRIGRTTVRVSPRRFHVVAPVADAVERAATAPAWTTIPLRAQVDSAKLSAWVGALAKRFARKPVEPQLFLRQLRPVITKPTPGLAVRQFPTRILLRNQLRDGIRKPILVPTRPIRPKTTAPVAIEPLVVIRRDENRLLLYHGMRLVRTFPVATGQAIYPTPLGQFQIVVKWKNPTWYPPTQDDWAKGLKPVPPGPGNPLGTRWMGLSAPGVGIHGTDDPASIGYSVSHGCIRMQVPSAEWLFDHVEVGTPVFIVEG